MHEQVLRNLNTNEGEFSLPPSIIHMVDTLIKKRGPQKLAGLVYDLKSAQSPSEAMTALKKHLENGTIDEQTYRIMKSFLPNLPKQTDNADKALERPEDLEDLWRFLMKQLKIAERTKNTQGIDVLMKEIRQHSYYESRKGYVETVLEDANKK